MKSAKTLAIVSCTVLLFTGVFALRAYAQDADSDSVDNSIPGEQNLVSLDGCWSGDVGKNLSQADTAAFTFMVSGSTIEPTSTFVFMFHNGQTLVMGTMSGTETSDGFKVKGAAGKKCKLTASGSTGGGGSNFLDGKYKFTGKCPQGIDKSGNISISMGC
jgi:hypothetical protein